MTETEPVSCADLLKILAVETRLAIVRELFRGPKLVRQLNETLDLEQSLLSHHLKVLRDAGIVQGDRDGKGVRYSLTPRFHHANAEALDLGCCQITFDEPAERKAK